MIVLGIETSCDETAVAIVDDQGNVLSHFLKSQWESLKTYKGVVPEIASRLHLDCLGSLIDQALTEACLSLSDLSGIAVTTGPGLMGGLIAGATTAKTLSALANRPFIAVNHLEAHALTIRLTEKIDFPYLLLLVSGGHCQLLIVEEVGNYQLLGTTLDDALGEAFDKTARLLDLSFPGGPAIEQLAYQGRTGHFNLPQAMVGRDNCDFSFSGIKTAVRRIIEQQSPLSMQQKADLCLTFQETVANIILDRCNQALKKAPQSISTLVIAGGVAANQYINRFLKLHFPLKVISPSLELCTDNGIMVAWAGIERLRKGWIDSLEAPLYPRWPLSDLRKKNMIIETVAIIGAGEWGRALSFLISKKIKKTILWHRPTKKIFSLPETVHCTNDKKDLQTADVVLFCVPSQHIRSVSKECADFIKQGAILLNCAKGIEQNTLLLMTEILAQAIPNKIYGVLSGPNFAREVLHGLPAAATIALEGGENYLPMAKDICNAFESSTFRLYWGADPTGMQIAGAVKNILAVGSGIIIAQGLGENARAAVLARGLSEMVRIGLSRGASLETFMGLTGVGDMILTCTSFQSRNFQYGYQLGKISSDSTWNEGLTTEGIINARNVLAFAKSMNVDVPLIETIHDIIEHQLPLSQAMRNLMSRPLSAE